MADFVGRAKELEREGHLQEALTYYDMAVEEKSGSFYVRCNQGTILNRLRQYNQANNYFDLVLVMDENHFDSIFGKGISSIGLGKWDDAFKYFKKCNEIDSENANVWYYLSILYKEKACKEEYTHSYKKFKELDKDDKNFEKIRSFYEFGINFKEKEIELINEFGEDFEKTDRYLNIESCVDFFNKIGLNDDEISFYLNSVPPDELNNNNELEKKIIYNDLLKKDFKKEEIDDLIRNHEIEDLKNVITSNSEINPFNEFEKLLYDQFRSMPIYHAYDYKIPNMDIIIEKEENKSIFKKLKIFFNSFDKNKEKKLINYYFTLLSEEIYSNNIIEVKNLFDKIESSNVNQFTDLKIKLDYFKVLIKYYCSHNIQYEEIYKPLEDISQFYEDIISNPVYIYIKSCILYDLHRYEDVIDNLKSIDLTEGTELNSDFIYYLKSCAYYKVGDYVRAYEQYNMISSKNLNSNTLNELSNLYVNQNDQKINLLLFF